MSPDPVLAEAIRSGLIRLEALQASIDKCSDHISVHAINEVSRFFQQHIRIALSIYVLTMTNAYDSPPLVPLVVQLTWLPMPSMFAQVYWLVPLGLVTLTFSMLMLEHTVGLEQTRYPTNGSYFLLVVPWKFLTVMSEMVSLDGNCYFSLEP
jgi:hypothetical protein